MNMKRIIRIAVCLLLSALTLLSVASCVGEGNEQEQVTGPMKDPIDDN